MSRLSPEERAAYDAAAAQGPGGRRAFLSSAAMACAGVWASVGHSARGRAEPSASQALIAWLGSADFAALVRSRMQLASIPGLSIAVIDGGRIVHTAGFGWADIDARRPMGPGTLINIASVTKTITCTAVMQLWEQDKVGLDDDVDAHLPFSVRNPAFPAAAVTLRQLLVHTSSIADGPAYEASYACGDPRQGLEAWLREYFTPGRAAYDAKLNFHDWEPGARYDYSNVAYGVLGLLIERLSGMGYAEYCAKRIFAPLGMSGSRFLLAGMDRSLHATPYRHAADGGLPPLELRDPAWAAPAEVRGAQVPHCLYGFATMPDGLARTSAAELARFLLAYLRGGEVDGERVLEPETVARILSEQAVDIPREPRGGIGLTWHRYRGGLWGHTGSDPGVSTSMILDPVRGRGVVVLTNAEGASKPLADLTRDIFDR